MIIFLIILGVILSFLGVIIIRTLGFKPKENAKVIDEEIIFDGEKAIECLRELVRCKTISYTDSSLEDNEEFEKISK